MHGFLNCNLNSSETLIRVRGTVPLTLFPYYYVYIILLLDGQAFHYKFHLGLLLISNLYINHKKEYTLWDYIHLVEEMKTNNNIHHICHFASDLNVYNHNVASILSLHLALLQEDLSCHYRLYGVFQMYMLYIGAQSRKGLDRALAAETHRVVDIPEHAAVVASGSVEKGEHGL